MILSEATKEDSIDDDDDDETSGNGRPSLVELKIITVDLPEIQEVNTEAIAKEKALLGAQLAGGPCVVEDTSLQFTALGGMPGTLFYGWLCVRENERNSFPVQAEVCDLLK